MNRSGVGHFRVAIEVGRGDGGALAAVDASVDTGATFTWIPRDVLAGTGVAPTEERPFVLADGRGGRGTAASLGVATRGDLLWLVAPVGGGLVPGPGLRKPVVGRGATVPRSAP